MMALHRDIGGASLSRLLHGIAEVRREDERDVYGVCIDSRSARRGDLFIACPGEQSNGIDYLSDALRAGIAAAVADAGSWDGARRLPIPVIPVRALPEKAGIIASRFFGDPTQDITVVGVTGTNGKTSVSHYIATAFSNEGACAGLIGTLGYGKVGALSHGTLTTPDAVTLQQTFAQMRDQNVSVVAMEVSSHALQQGRVAGVEFDIAVFTNLTRDHLDFHGDMHAYAAAKRLMFDVPGLRHGIVNLDDDFGRQLRKDLSNRIPITGYRMVEGIGADRLVAGEVIAAVTESKIGRLMVNVVSPWGSAVLECGLTGRFNAYNLLAALASLCLLDMRFERAVGHLCAVRPVPGRMETFLCPGGPRVVVDYAHTPDALTQALRALKGQCRGALICVFGCGGDRDRGKRPEMGAVAAAIADRIIVTSDNPRSEPPELIIREILKGAGARVHAEVQPDRATAIADAIAGAGEDDVVLIAGKGHETYQEIAGIRYPFSDRQLVRRLLEDRA